MPFWVRLARPAQVLPTCLFLLVHTASAPAAPNAGTAVSSSLEPGGLASLRYRELSLLPDPASGRLHPVNNTPRLVRPDRTTYTGAVQPTSEQLDRAANTIHRQYPWGEITCTYRQDGPRLILSGRIGVRAHGDSLEAITLELAELSFPTIPLGNVPDPGQFGMGRPHPLQQYPLLAPGQAMPPVIEVNFEQGVLAFCSEEAGSPAVIEIPSTTNPPAATRYPFWISLGNIPSGSQRAFKVSFRFGPAGSAARVLAHDLYERFAALYPFRLQWDDRRPIGANFLASSGNHPAKNPRGWFNNAADIDITTDTGKETFRSRLLQYADDSIKVLRQMNAQGVITWDPEGEESGQATYYGDPRLVPTVAPEMEYQGTAGMAAVDAYFKRFRDAGFRVGVCIRPQQIRFVNGAPVQEDAADPARLMEEKISYARRRWGCTLFYVDSTVIKERPLDAAIFETIAGANPGVLLIPENQNYRYYAVTAPLDSFFHHGVTETSPDVRAAYPGAFTVLLGPGGGSGGSTESHRAPLISGLKQGDIMTFRSWFPDDENAPIKKLYDEVGTTPSARIVSPATGATIPPGSNVTITAEVTTGSHPIKTVEFFQSTVASGRVRLGQVTRPPYRWIWRRPTAGQHILSIQVTDVAEAIRVPSAVMVLVK